MGVPVYRLIYDHTMLALPLAAVGPHWLGSMQTDGIVKTCKTEQLLVTHEVGKLVIVV